MFQILHIESLKNIQPKKNVYVDDLLLKKNIQRKEATTLRLSLLMLKLNGMEAEAEINMGI